MLEFSLTLLTDTPPPDEAFARTIDGQISGLVVRAEDGLLHFTQVFNAHQR